MGFHIPICHFASGFDPWFRDSSPLSQPSVKYFFDADSTEVYVTGDPPSGNIVGKVASNVLTPVTTPLYQQTVVGARKGCGFDTVTTDSFDAANNTIHDLTTGPIAVLAPFYTNVLTNGFETVVGKTTFSGTGWQLQFRTGLRWLLKGTGGPVYVGAGSLAAGLSYAFCWRSVALATMGLYTNFQAELTVPDTSGDCTSATTFALGSCGSQLAAGVNLGSTVIWTGAAAETVIANRATNLPIWWAKVLS